MVSPQNTIKILTHIYIIYIHNESNLGFKEQILQRSQEKAYFFVFGLGSFDKFDAENRWFKEDLAAFNHGDFRGIHDKCVTDVVFSVTSPEVTLRIKKLRKENQEMEHQKLDLG